MNLKPTARVRLLPARWVRLPGTTWEVYLHGKRYGSGSVGVEVCRSQERDGFGGWDLTPVRHRIYLRKTR